MMRFILDCLRPGRQRAGASNRENSLELQSKEKETANQLCDEIKELQEKVAEETGALQDQRAQRCQTQEALESLAQSRFKLKEQLEEIQEQRQQESQLLLSLQEEQEELEERVQEYQQELGRAREELLCLQEEVARAETQIKDAHSQIGQLQDLISESYDEVTEAKLRLGALITEVVAGERSVAAVINQHLEEESAVLQGSIHIGANEEDVTIEEDLIYHSEGNLKQDSEDDAPKIEHNKGNIDRPYSTENLKSSGSSSFTEITLTEVKEEDASASSMTPQVDSPDLEEEEAETSQLLMTQVINQTTSMEFDFYHPHPFTEHGVFGDEHFPEVDVAEFLSGDPFKGTDPFASDVLFSQTSEDAFPQDQLLTEGRVPTDAVLCDGQSFNEVESEAHFNAGVNDFSLAPLYLKDSEFSAHSLETNDMGHLDLCSHAGVEKEIPSSHIKAQQDLYHAESTETKIVSHESTSPQVNRQDLDKNGHRLQKTYDTESNSRASNDRSVEGLNAFACTVSMGTKLETEAGFHCSMEGPALSSPQSKGTRSYTSSPELRENFSFCPEFSSQDSNHSPRCVPHDFENERFSPCSSEPVNTDNYDHKFGDIYFFTVRLDPGSPELRDNSPPDPNGRKSESVGQARWMQNHVNTAPNFTERFDDNHPVLTDAVEYSLKLYTQEDSHKDSIVQRPQDPFSSEANEERTRDSDVQNPDTSSYEVQNECNKPVTQDVFKQDLFSSETDGSFGFDSNLGAKQFDGHIMPPDADVCTSEHNFQYLISPVSCDTENVVSSGHKACDNTFSTELKDTHFDPFAFKTFDTKEFDSIDSDFRNFESLSPLPLNKRCESEFSALYLINPITEDKERFNVDYHQLHACDPCSPKATETEGCHPEPRDPNMSKAEATKPLCPYSLDTRALTELIDIRSMDHSNYTADNCEPVKTVSSGMKISGSLDLTEHRLTACDPFSPESTDTKNCSPSFIGFCPVSPLSADTGKYGSNLDNAPFLSPETQNILGHDFMKPNTSDLFCPQFSHDRWLELNGSEAKDRDPFSPVPHDEQIDDCCSTDENCMCVSTLIKPEPSGETRSSSWSSGASSSPQINNYDCILNRKHTNEASHVNHKGHGSSCVSGHPSESECSDIAECDFGSKTCNQTNQDTKNSPVAVTTKADLVEIHQFCSELSKMVSSHSTDSVQHCVAEMLFGSDPNTAQFYPWDFENSNTVVNDLLSPEADFENRNNFGNDRLNPERGSELGPDLRNSVSDS